MNECSILSDTSRSADGQEHFLSVTFEPFSYPALVPALPDDSCLPEHNPDAPPLPEVTQDYTVVAGDCIDKIIKCNYKPATNAQLLTCRAAILQSNTTITDIKNIRLGQTIRLPIIIGALVLLSYEPEPFPNFTETAARGADLLTASNTEIYSFPNLDSRTAAAMGDKWLDDIRNANGLMPLSTPANADTQPTWRQLFAVAGFESRQLLATEQSANLLRACIGQITNDWQVGTPANQQSVGFRNQFLERARDLITKLTASFPSALKQQFETAVWSATRSIFQSMLFISTLTPENQEYLTTVKKNLESSRSQFYQSNVFCFDTSKQAYFDLYMQGRCCDCDPKCLADRAKTAAQHFGNLKHEGLGHIFIRMKHQAQARGFDSNTGEFEDTKWRGYVALLETPPKRVATL